MWALAVAVVGASLLASTSATAAEVDLLVFTKTAGYRHESIPVAIAAVQQIAADRGWSVVASEDAAMFEPTMLASFEVVVFLSTTGDVLDDAQQAALQGFVEAGGGFVGVHSASNTEESWPWYVGLVGTTFADHPAIQMATLHVVDPDHPATMGLPNPWVRTDEWYNFTASPSATVDVLLQLDETTYTGGTMGRDHPIAWAHEYDGGRSFYTALGHTNESWSEPEFLAHVAGGLEWAATPTAGGTSTDTGSTDTSGSTSTTTASADASSGPATTTTSSTSSTTSANAESSTSTSTAASISDDSAGCGCRSAPRPWWLALVLLARRHRRTEPRQQCSTSMAARPGGSAVRATS